MSLKARYYACGLLSLMMTYWTSSALPGTTTSTSSTATNASTDPEFHLNPSDFSEPTVEDKYIQFFGNDPSLYHKWTKRSVVRLKKVCEEAHFRDGRGLAIIYNVFVNMSTLKFRNEKYSPMKIDVVTYDIKDYGYYNDPDTSGNRFYLTKGTRDDCVYYLTQANSNNMEFYLDRHVCGII